MFRLTWPINGATAWGTGGGAGLDVQTFGVGELSYVVVTGNIALVYDSDKIAQVFICLPRPLLTCFPLRQGVKIGGKATKTTITN